MSDESAGAPPILVLHQLGDEAGGRPWAAALNRAGWTGPVLAPDLPGHAGAPAPVGGAYELLDPAVEAGRLLAADAFGGAAPVVVGIGVSGWSAWMVAAAGRSAGLVLVDGLGGPWLDPVGAIGQGREWLRALADDPAAIDPPPARGGLDPRLRHSVPPLSSREGVVDAAACTTVPVLIVTSPRSPLDIADIDDLAAHFASAVTRVDVTSPDPDMVVPELVGWAAALPTVRGR